MLSSKALRSALANLTPHPFEGTAYRLVHVRHQHTALSAIGSQVVSGRFHRKGEIQAVYLALDPVTALYEVGALIHTDRRITAQPGDPRVLISVTTSLEKVIDLRDADVQASLGTNYTELTVKRNWNLEAKAGDSATQELGHAAHDLGLHGLLYPSAQHPAGSNLVTFPSNLSPGSLRIIDDSGTLQGELP